MVERLRPLNECIQTQRIEEYVQIAKLMANKWKEKTKGLMMGGVEKNFLQYSIGEAVSLEPMSYR